MGGWIAESPGRSTELLRNKVLIHIIVVQMILILTIRA